MTNPSTPKPDVKHPAYDEMYGVWKDCRAAKTGQRAVHKEGEAYLPRLSGQTDQDYKAYLLRATYFNATGRTVEGMEGLVFRKKPMVVMPDSMKPWAQDISRGGHSLEGFARTCVGEVITTARGGILVDHPNQKPRADGSVPTVAEVAKSGARPYFAYYTAENIYNWEQRRVDNVFKTVNIWLAEPVNDIEDVPSQIRQLSLDSGVYTQILWTRTKRQWTASEPITPLMNGKALTDIPFWFLAPKEPDCNIQDPPIEDLAIVNLSHFRNSADLENGAHVAGQPTPYVTGLEGGTDEKGDPLNVLTIGSNTAWILPDVNSKVGFLQCGQEGFASLEKLMDRKENQMAALGARLIAPEKKAAETAETAGIRRGGENSVLSSIARSVSMQIEKAWKFAAEWAGIPADKVTFSLNLDFLPTTLDAQMLTALVGAWQAGAMSDEAFFDALQQGEIFDESVTFEDEKSRREADGPKLGVIGTEDDPE
ncbi:MAG: hypothetical protein JWO78_199 [Micavibrio sp.]|nr:hypothetical protein [Micavibrio sp.]